MRLLDVAKCGALRNHSFELESTAQPHFIRVETNAAGSFLLSFNYPWCVVSITEQLSNRPCLRQDLISILKHSVEIYHLRHITQPVSLPLHYLVFGSLVLNSAIPLVADLNVRGVAIVNNPLLSI